MWPELTDPHLLVYFLGVAIQLAAAAWLFYLAPGDARHRSFAVLITCNAIWDVLEGLFHAAPPAREEYYLRLYAYLFVWTVAATVWFLSVYPAPRRFAAITSWAALTFAAVTTLWLAVDRDAIDNSLLELVNLGWTPLFAFGAWILLREVQRRPRDPRTWSMILVALSLLVYPVSHAAELFRPMYWTGLADNLAAARTFEGILTGVVEVAFFLTRVAAIPLAAWGVWLAHRQAEQGPRKAAFLGGLMAFILLIRFAESYGEIIPGENALVFGILVSYALARAQLFDIELRLKVTISRGTVLGAFGVVFFVVSQMAEIYFQQGGNYLLGGVACGLLLFAYAPLQRWADRVATKALPPDVKDTPEYALRRKHEIYLAALASVLDDERITPKEQRMLDALAKRLQLTASDVVHLRREVGRMLATVKRAGPSA